MFQKFSPFFVLLLMTGAGWVGILRWGGTTTSSSIPTTSRSVSSVSYSRCNLSFSFAVTDELKCPRADETEFKVGRIELFEYPSEIGIQVGEYLLVEAGRGVDLSRVLRVVPRTALLASVAYKKVLRRAHVDEVLLLPSKTEDEIRALNIVRPKIRQRGLPMEGWTVIVSLCLSLVARFFLRD